MTFTSLEDLTKLIEEVTRKILEEIILKNVQTA